MIVIGFINWEIVVSDVDSSDIGIVSKATAIPSPFHVTLHANSKLHWTWI